MTSKPGRGTLEDVRFRARSPLSCISLAPRRLWESALRFGGVTWGRDDLALVGEWWYSSRTTRTWIVDPAHPEKEPRLFEERNYQDANIYRLLF